MKKAIYGSSRNNFYKRSILRLYVLYEESYGTYEDISADKEGGARGGTGI